ncbi:unnamed protein product, partial [Citrullus colocynthis]
MGSSTSEKSSEKALMNSPFSLNPVNQISITKLTENNYLAWRFQVLNVIQGHRLEEHIDEDSKIPEKLLHVLFNENIHPFASKATNCRPMQTYSVSQSLPVLVRNSTENNPLPALSPTDMPPSSSIHMSSSPIT